MEPRFGHDFSQVRVHRDAQAAASARAVNALAYTVGRNLVFGAGQYSPATDAGQSLMAHELTHVVQQSANKNDRVQTVRVAQPNEPAEEEAEYMSRAVPESTPFSVRVSTASQVARQKPSEGKLESTKKALDLAENHAKKALTSDERDKIAKTLQATPPAVIPKFSEGTRFVLHDTASRVELTAAKRKEVEADFLKKWTSTHKEEPKDAEVKKTSEAQKKKELGQADELARQKIERTGLEGHERNERGPLDEGAAAWVPEAGRAVIARPQFFDSRRPSTTQFERRADIIGMEERERAFEKIWQATNPLQQDAALKGSLTGLELTPKKGESKKDETLRSFSQRKMTADEVTAEQTKAKEQLAKPLPAKFAKDEKPHFWTTASWSIEKVCDQLKTKKAEDLAVSKDKAKDIESGCKALQKYFAEREPRLGSMVNVEIIKPTGSNCNTDEKKFTLVPLPPYTENQYQQTSEVYLRTALQAGQFPEVTTHFWLDRFDASGHCDPRCFHLQYFYDTVATKIGHKKGSLYGILANPGPTRGTHNVWWNNTVCGGGPP